MLSLANNKMTREIILLCVIVLLIGDNKILLAPLQESFFSLTSVRIIHGKNP